MKGGVRVDLPWSICAIMEKFRILEIGFSNWSEEGWAAAREVAKQRDCHPNARRRALSRQLFRINAVLCGGHRGAKRLIHRTRQTPTKRRLSRSANCCLGLPDSA